MGKASTNERQTAEEYFSAEDYEWLANVAAYDRDDPDRLVFADDGDCAEVCECYATHIVDGDWYWFLDMLKGDYEDVIRFAGEPDYGRCLALCLRYCIDVVDDSPWYAERLEQAIAGQDRARKLMDEMGVDLAKRSRLRLP